MDWTRTLGRLAFEWVYLNKNRRLRVDGILHACSREVSSAAAVVAAIGEEDGGMGR